MSAPVHVLYIHSALQKQTSLVFGGGIDAQDTDGDDIMDAVLGVNWKRGSHEGKKNDVNIMKGTKKAHKNEHKKPHGREQMEIRIRSGAHWFSVVERHKHFKSSPPNVGTKRE